MRYVLALDALIAISFGAASGLMPLKIYGSIVSLEHPATLAALTSLSLFYALLGTICIVAIFSPRPQQLALAGVMLARHLLSGIKGVFEAGASWQVGNPTPDLVIHGAFVLLYAVFIIMLVRHTAPATA